MAIPAKQLLIETRDWLTDHPNAWTTEFNAEDEDGNAVGICCPSAVRFCPLGYMRKLCGTPWDQQNRSYDKAKRLLSTGAESLYKQPSFDALNDNTELGYDAVLAVFKWAIDQA